MSLAGSLFFSATLATVHRSCLRAASNFFKEARAVRTTSADVACAPDAAPKTLDLCVCFFFSRKWDGSRSAHSTVRQVPTDSYLGFAGAQLCFCLDAFRARTIFGWNASQSRTPMRLSSLLRQGLHRNVRTQYMLAASAFLLALQGGRQFPGSICNIPQLSCSVQLITISWLEDEALFASAALPHLNESIDDANITIRYMSGPGRCAMRHDPPYPGGGQPQY